MSRPESTVEEPYQPKGAGWLALLAFVLAALTLCAPMLAGKFLLGDDQYTAGYAFRLYGADWFRTHGAIPQWNPYLFGGMPFIAAMHGDIFYPTAWLRWILPIDTAMNLGLAMHLMLAGAFMYLFLRALRLGWTACVAGGIAYELSGIVASMVSPGHDGKLYVSALAPLAFFALLRAVRDRRAWGYALFALVVGLGLLSPHMQMTYYLLVAAGIWMLYLVFFDPDRPADLKWPIPLVLALGGIVLGLGVAAIQILPFLKYVPWSPRHTVTWDYATSWAMAPSEIFTMVLPQFNGVLDAYWGGNVFKLQTEYLGVLVVIPAFFAFGDGVRRRLVLTLAVIGGLFLLVAFGGHTPFYRIWYSLMPMMNKVRAAGMAFYLVALCMVVLAAIGIDRVMRREVSWKTVGIVTALLGVFAALGAAGALQAVAEVFVTPERTEKLAADAPLMRAGALRLLVFVVLTAGVLWALLNGMLRRAIGAGALVAVMVGDLYSVDRLYFHYQAPARETFKDDAIIAFLHQVKPPYRVWDPQGVYPGSWLMAHGVQSMLGYHGNQVRFYDALLGGKLEGWPSQGNPNLWDLLAVRYILVRSPQPIPGFHQVAGPASTTPGADALVYEQDSIPPYARVVAAAVKVQEDRLVPTILDSRFPSRLAALYPDTASVNPAPLSGGIILEAPVKAEVAEWTSGDMTIRLTGSSEKGTYLVVSETWYPDWQVTIDGRPAPLLRADYALLSAALPPGAREVRLHFVDRAYPRGKLVTAGSLLLTGLLLAVPLLRRRRATGV